jgi:diguanylate cyclase (GGDEF)-like protein
VGSNPAFRRAFVDPLTHLPSRYAALEALQEAGSRGVRGSLLTADVDRFKLINDRHGHVQADKVLRIIALRLRRNLPSTALIGRLGGDEFIIFLPEMSTEVSLLVARGALQRIREPLQLAGGAESVTLSVGLSAYNGQPLAEALRASDIAMYAAKARGRDQVVVFGEETRSIVTARRELAATVIELQERNRVLQDEVRTDALTGLRNRKALDEVLDFVVGPGHESDWPAASVLFIDIDHFGSFNKLHGDARGDEALRSVARAIQGRAREGDLVFRKGGEELVVVLPGTSEVSATAAAERIRSCVEQLSLPHSGSATARVLTVTIGVASASTASTVRALLNAAANRAMAAKVNGERNMVHATTLA